MEWISQCSEHPSYQPLWIHRRKKRNVFPFSHYQSQSPLSVSVTGKLVRCHAHMAPHSTGVREDGSSIQRPGCRATGLGRNTPPSHSTAKRNVRGWNPHLLPKHIWGFPASVVWLTALVSEGLALCTPNVKTQPDECLSGQRVVEWVVSDVGGWKRLGRKKGGDSGKVLPQESENLIWPQESSCPLRRAAVATASAFSLMAQRRVQLAYTVRGEHDDTACSTPATWFESPLAPWLKGRSATDEFLPETNPRWKHLFLAALSAQVAKMWSRLNHFFHPFWLFNAQEIKGDVRKATGAWWGCGELSVGGLNSRREEKACCTCYRSIHISRHVVPPDRVFCTAD